jgi:Tol biopolymer transport system component
MSARSPLRAVRPDGTTVDLPPVPLFSGARFLRDGSGLVYMQGSNTWQDFWVLDLASKTSRPLTHLAHSGTMRSFDITPDGKQIVFDRMRENSDIVLIDLPERKR